MAREKYKWRLNETIEQRLGDSSYGHQRAIYDGEQLLLILHEPPQHDQTDRVYAVFLREKDGSWQFKGQKKGENQLRQVVDSYRQSFTRFEQRYDKATTSDCLFSIIEDLNPSVRAIKNLAGALQSARELCKLDKLILELRDEAADLQRCFELLLDETRFALDYRIAKNAEEQISESRKMAKAQHKLNLMAAITFPLMAMASLFGMDLVTHWKEVDPLFFNSVLVGGFALGFFTLKWITKEKD